MGSRIRENPKRMFEFFVEVTKGDEKVADISQRFPATYSDEGVVKEIPKFAFPCETDGVQVEHFSFVISDLSGMFRFGFCRLATGHQSCLCVVSWLPWFDTFYKMLDHVSKLITSGDQTHLHEFLQEIYDHDVPGPKVPVSIIGGQQMFNFTAPDSSELARIPGNINLTEYYNALDSSNMMLVFASMLQERRIYMMSKRLNRLTSCIYAAEALLYPLNWQHTFIPVLPGHVIECLGLMTPYIIGVHGNLLGRLDELQEDLEETVFVDLDNNTVTSEHDDLGRLPWNVFNALKKDLKAEKLKDSMQKTGDALSMAFLKAIVRLIGGYKDALKVQPGEPVTFDEKLFIHSRPSSSFHVYLEGMLSLQLFQEFIHARVDSLNAGLKTNDVFEQQVAIYAERHKKRNKSNFKELKVKAAPTITTAVHSIKKQSRRAISSVISGLLVDSDYKKGDKLKDASEGLPADFQDGVSFSNPNDTAQHASFASADDFQEKTHSRPKLAILVRELSQDDSSVSLTYQSPNMSLLDDLDIQEVLRRSPSNEILCRQVGKLSSSSSSSSLDESDSSVTSPRNDPKKPAESVKKGAADAAVVTKDKLIRPGGGDKLIRPAKTNAKRQSLVKSSALSRLLSTRRSRDYTSLVSQDTASSAGNSKPLPELPAVKELETQKPGLVSEMSKVVIDGINKVDTSPDNAGNDQPPLLIDFGSSDPTSENVQFDPLEAKNAEEYFSLESGPVLTDIEGQAKSTSDGSMNFDIFGSIDFASFTAAAASENTCGTKNGLSVTGSTLKNPNLAPDRFQSVFNTQQMPVINTNISLASTSSQQGNSFLPGVNQMTRQTAPVMNSQLPSSINQPRMNSNTIAPGISFNSSALVNPAFSVPPVSQAQHSQSVYMTQTLFSPIRPNQIRPGSTQRNTNWDAFTTGKKSESATVSSVFEAKSRDSLTTTTNSAASTKTQADLLSDLIGVDFSSSNGNRGTRKN